ncbi:hypothetical protein BC939DRAFT_507024 [Gamsiella multidivaricata]|uniref:uncharacterized protein n=1 Tax=Gamsiella multidivaricata TaxID=101098 RepID=UPI00221EC18B|nr:uncharacterized protein BC939DRAFT_507024 [Gamsiella multidivaricata]KAG0369322.1 hypothetical protein BGZ54_010280 [Gamsiella multidivaricata]KAI7817854.1 hypothetical protein BC939DRAFT_507024 [Gamsiella multidivaricata]
MAILNFNKDSDKSISLHFDTPELGPEGQPLYYSTPETPAVIRGHVEFRTVKPTNGGDIAVTFEARSEAEWTENHGESVASYHAISRLQEKSWDVKLNRIDAKTISPGVTRYNFEVQLDSELPPSIEGKRGWFHYRFKAHIRRDFPRRDMAVKQLVWVYSSSIRANEQIQPKVYSSILNDIVPFTCTLPSNVLYQGQIVPLTVLFEPFRENSIHKGQELIVVGAAVKLKQYTTLAERRKLKNKSLGTSRKKEKKVVIHLPVAAEEWPQTSQGFTKTIMVEPPGARQLAASIETEPLIKTYCLKLIMKVRTNLMSDKEAKEVRMEMNIKITSPRPEHIRNEAPDSLEPPPYQAIDSEDEEAIPPEIARRSSSSSLEGPSYPADVKHASGL